MNLLQVYNGISDNSPLIKKRFCGDELPGIIESSGSQMGVVFGTDGSVSNGGFRARWSSNRDRSKYIFCVLVIL